MKRFWSDRADTAFILSSLVFCFFIAAGQSVNPFPEDGWFQSQYKLFVRMPGAANFIPIAAPAVFYAFVHQVALLFRLTLERELYLACVFHNLLLFLSACFLYYSNKLLGIFTPGFLVSFCTLLFTGSLFLTQSFWSETISIFLISSILYITIKLYAQPTIYFSKTGALTITWAFLLALLTATRTIPIIILPSTVLLFRFHPAKKAALRFSIYASILTACFLLAYMTGNYYRFGRFEWSNSIGRHLWDAISPHADEMLSKSPVYQSVKRMNPNISGSSWYMIPNFSIPEELSQYSPEEIFKQLSLEAIAERPDLYLLSGLKKTYKYLFKPPDKIGLWGSRYHYNPLNRDVFLPPLLPQFTIITAVLNVIYAIGRRLYPILVFLSLYVFYCLAFGGYLCRNVKESILRRGSEHWMSSREHKYFRFYVWVFPLLAFGVFLNIAVTLGLVVIIFVCYKILLHQLPAKEKNEILRQCRAGAHNYGPILAFLVLTFILCILATCLVEEEGVMTRYVAPNLPLLSLMTSISLQIFMTTIKVLGSRKNA